MSSPEIWKHFAELWVTAVIIGNSRKDYSRSCRKKRNRKRLAGKPFWPCFRIESCEFSGKFSGMFCCVAYGCHSPEESKKSAIDVDSMFLFSAQLLLPLLAKVFWLLLPTQLLLLLAQPSVNKSATVQHYLSYTTHRFVVTGCSKLVGSVRRVQPSGWDLSLKAWKQLNTSLLVTSPTSSGPSKDVKLSESMKGICWSIWANKETTTSGSDSSGDTYGAVLSRSKALLISWLKNHSIQRFYKFCIIWGT